MKKINSIPDETRLYLCLDIAQPLVQTLVFPGAGLLLPVSQHTFKFPNELQIYTCSQIIEFTKGIKTGIQASQAAGIQTSRTYMLFYLSTRSCGPHLLLLLLMLIPIGPMVYSPFYVFCCLELSVHIQLYTSVPPFLATRP